MFNTYSYRGEPIENIEQWAKDHNEKMVDVVYRVREVNPYTKNPKNMIQYEEVKAKMPESFFNTLKIPQNHSIKSYKLREPKIEPNRA